MRKSLLASIALLLFCLASMAATPTRPDESVMTPFKFQPKPTQKVHNNSQLTQFTDLTSKTEKERLARKGIKVFRSFDTLETKDGKNTTTNKFPMKEGEQNYTLTVNLKYDKNEIVGFAGTAYPNYEGSYGILCNWSDEEFPNELLFTVPEGNYDVEILLTTFDWDFILLTAEDVNVISDMEISLDVADATTEIVWKPLLPDGSMPHSDIVVFEDGSDEILNIIEGNVLIIDNLVSFYNKKHDTSTTQSINPLIFMIGDERYETGHCNIRTMPNENYQFNFLCKAINSDGGYVIPLLTEAMQSRMVTNDINNYQSIAPEYAYTPYQPEPLVLESENGENLIMDFDKNKSFFLNFLTLRAGTIYGVFGMILNTIDVNFKNLICICNDPKYSGIFEVLPIPSLAEDWDYGMSGLPIDINLTSPIAMAINNTSFPNTFLKLPEVRETYLSKVTNPWFSFDITKPHIWNYGCPTQVFYGGETPWGAFFNFSYIGRLGENREVDLISTLATVAVNGEAPSDEVLENIQWGQLPKEGKIDFEFTNTNVAIDDIPGKNIAHVSFDRSRSDWQPPTLQLVRFVDTEYNFTDRYLTGKDGVIEFYGGDFIYHQNPQTYAEWYTEVAATTVNVEYAPYGTEAFLPIEVNNIPERDFMPGFGTYYTGSLSSVDRKSENGWFDVRITLTDAEGNYQEQTLSPAFKIEECVGMETMVAPEIGVAIINGNINVGGCESPLIEIFSTDGILLKRIASNSIDASEFSPGIYLINVIDGNKRAMRKVRI